MKIHEQLKEEMKEAMKEKNQEKLGVIRGLLSGLANEAIAKGYGPAGLLSDEESLTVIKRAAKQRKDAMEQFTAGDRSDLAENEKAELILIEKYLPSLMSREEIKKIAQAKKIELAVNAKSDAGKLMNALMKDLKGQADGAEVKAVVEEILS